MLVDVRGRVNNIDLKPHECLLPLFETIINAIHAIEDAKVKDGSITIKVHRDKNASLYSESEVKKLLPIVGFDVVDNGIGFTDDNFLSFSTSDSRYKVSRGGKGVGRFLWLKAFDYAEVRSLYNQDGVMKQRSFTFSLENDDPIVDPTVTDVRGSEELTTTVHLKGFKQSYESHAPHSLEKIGQQIIEHCLKYFALNKMPSIALLDLSNSQKISLNEVYTSWVKEAGSSNFQIQEHDFTLAHFLLEFHAGMSHKVSYCGDDRVVIEDVITKRISNLTPTVEVPGQENENKVVYAGYLSSGYLDKKVNQQRTGFNGLAAEGGLRYGDELAWSEIESATLQASREYLQKFTDPIRDEKSKQIERFVKTQAPEYRNLLKHNIEDLDTIPAGLTDDKLRVELFKVQTNVEVKLKETAQQILNVTEDLSKVEVRQKYEQFLEEWNDLGKANLAKYIVHRRITLHFLDEALKKNKEGKYVLEEVIHETVFPMRTTSDEIDFEDHNLWIVDERLAYHYYLASDIPLKQVEDINSESSSRPDILIFNGSIAVVDDKDQPYSSVVLLEFKRPMRDNYESDENPIEQIYRYVRKIKDSKALTREGRPIRVHETTPFYCYIICDLTPKLELQAKDYGFQQTPDQLGYYNYSNNYGAYVEIISFDKLINDAYKRNQILFDKLNINEGLALATAAKSKTQKRQPN